MNARATSIEPKAASAEIDRAKASCQWGDAELLQSYIADEKDESFQLLLQRHWALVYGVAYRRTGDAALSQDIAQAVFIVLDRKCRGFSKGTVLAGWLFRTTMFTTNNVLKSEVRRREREQWALADFSENEANPARAWEAISKDLDQGLESLPAADRETLILRFLQDRSFKEVGQALGLNENSARQRALRALEKLRCFLRKRGIVYPVGLLALAFEARPAQCAPRGGLTSNAAQFLARETLSGMNWRRAKTTVACSLALAILLSGLVTMLSLGMERREAIARRRSIETVDMTLWRGDGTGFARTIAFGTAEPNSAQQTLTGYAVAFYEFRQSFEARFSGAAPGSIGTMRALSWLAGDRIKEQPVVNRHNYAINQIVPGYSMHLIRQDNVWKWNLFENLTAAEANTFLNVIQRQKAIFEDLRIRLDRGDFDQSEGVLQALRKKISPE